MQVKKCKRRKCSGRLESLRSG